MGTSNKNNKNNKNVNVKSQYIPGINLNIHHVLTHSI